MIYEVIMPQLSDSMDEGKLISWKVSVGDSVKSGDVIAEVESDKAVMEVQTFQDGVVKELLIKEGAEAKVGSVMAKIETDAKESTTRIKKVEKKREEKEPKVEHIEDKSSKKVSPKARLKAAEYGLEITDIIEKSKDEIVHAQDIENYLTEKYFTPKAMALLQEYQLESSCFELNHKIDSDEVREYIESHNIALLKRLTPMQKAIISNVTAAANRPTFHIYEVADASLLQKHKEKSVTVWLIKIIAQVMMEYASFRSKLLDGEINVLSSSSLSIAVADEKNLYMPVIKHANRLSVDEIESQLKSFQEKLKDGNFSQSDMEGSSFGISNLGMLGVERFDAMINRDDVTILAVGAIRDGKISLTLTVDHRVINGYEAALFMQKLKEELTNSLNFKMNL